MTNTKPMQIDSYEKKSVVSKRSVSFTSHSKHSAPSSSSGTKKPLSMSKRCTSDGGLQASGNRRRYMRRGSKSSSMLMMLAQHKLPELSAEMSLVDSAKNMTHMMEPPSASQDHAPHQHPQHPQQQQRRVSLIGALRLSLEKTSLVDNKVIHPDYSMMTPEERRKSTYELLSQI